MVLKKKHKTFLGIAIAGAFLVANVATSVLKSNNSHSANTTIEKAYQSKQSDLQVKGSGRVVKILKDDLKGHKHQRFLLGVGSNRTILIAHNIDLAPKITSLKKGDTVEFYGEYEYNKKGGVVHWTHHDPRKRHKDGWLRHDGKTYE